MKKINFIIHMFILVLWIIMFFIANYASYNLDYGAICGFLWFALPVIMFVFNTFLETQLRRLALLYFISAVMQILGVFMHIFLYYHFISDEPGTSVVGQVAILITAVLNLVLAIVGITIKSLILRFKKH